MKTLVLIISIGISSAFGQLTLDSCFSMAERHFRYDLESENISQSGKYSREIAGKSWYPELNFEYRSTIQNEQLEFPGGVPGQSVPEVPLDFHRALINFSQNIYDGSISAHRKTLEKYKSESAQYELEIQRIQLKSRVLQVYMGILLTRNHGKSLADSRKSLESQLDRIKAAVNSGVILISDQRILEAELLSLEQRIMEVQSREEQLIAQLGLTIGKDLKSEIELEPPVVEVKTATVENRPETQLMRTQIQLMDASTGLQNSRRMPKVALFGSGGMGNPGYNILEKGWQPMAIVGIGVQWEIWDWNEVKNEKKIISLNKERIDNAIHRKQIQIDGELVQQEKEIERLEELIRRDGEIVSLRNEVVEVKSAQLENGTATSSEYITELNKASMAGINQQIHELELVQARINYNIISGNL